MLQKQTPKFSEREPRKHQEIAINNAIDHFVTNRSSRGKLIHPCGTGKSLIGYWVAEALQAKTILVALPSLYLVRQTLTDWTKESIERVLDNYSQEHANAKLGKVAQPLRIAVSGGTVSPAIFDTLSLIQSETVPSKLEMLSNSFSAPRGDVPGKSFDNGGITLAARFQKNLIHSVIPGTRRL